MRHLIRNIVIIAVALVIAGLSIWPPAEKLRRGKDLAGGVSLVYAVEVPPGEDSSDALSTTIEVLKERIDPTGQMDITMIAQGDNRIEISMPLPSDRVIALRKDFEAALDGLAQLSVGEEELDRIVALPRDQREERIQDLASGNEERAALIRSAAEASDAARRARQAYREAADGGADEATLDQLVQIAADAELAYEDARTTALTTGVGVDELRNALELPDTEKVLVDRETETTIVLESPRSRALERIRSENPGALDLINEVIARYEIYAAERRGFDDPNDLIRLLQGSGVLSFRIAPSPGEISDEQALRQQLQESGPRALTGREVAWFALEDIDAWLDDASDLEALKRSPQGFFSSRSYVVEERDGIYYMLLYDSRGMRLTDAEGDWEVSQAFPQPDELGRPAIGFRMDASGARRLGELTGANVGKPMAILLDDRVYTAPFLRGRISSQGQITGQFSNEDIQYVVRTLRAGSLTAKLADEPMFINQLAPSLGADNLQKGLVAGIYALVIVCSFMIAYYFGAGVIAVVALLCNALLLLGAMSLGRAAFTMPGIAGVILTFGIAVDANVLIYERIREELFAGQKLKAAVRLGYQKALSAIVDGNITNLIVCLVLAFTGTVEVRGFATTLGIGVVTTLFSALLITRVVFTVGLEHLRWKRIPMLATAIPVVHRTLEPNIDWLGLRWMFRIVSIVLIGLAVFAMAYQQEEMFDNEFRGGTAATVELKRVDPDGDGPAPAEQLTLKRNEVEDRIRAIATSAPPDSPQAKLLTAQVIAINPLEDDVTASSFTVKTTATDVNAVRDAVSNALSEYLEARPPLSFTDARWERIIDPELGENIGRPAAAQSVRDFVGGVAVVVEGINPPATLQDLQRRLREMRAQPDHSETLTRPHEIIVLEGDRNNVSAVAVVAVDPAVSLFDDEARWRIDVAEGELQLVQDALQRSNSLAGLQSFSPAIAATFAAQAVVSIALSLLGILIYIWVRFGSARYSVAAVVTTLHDVFIAVGLIAAVEILYEHAPGVATGLGLEPFKIDLAMIAAILTILGYSLNDTIIIMDRIRENRGKLPYATRDVVNLSINQTISRTVITSGTTLMAILMLYIFGGSGVRGFAFAMLVGIGVGTYSSIAVAAPLVWQRNPPPARPMQRPAGQQASEGELAAV